MKVGKRTAKLLREAMVLGYVNGRWDGHGKASSLKDHAEDYPKDSEITFAVLRAARSHPDLYPLLCRVEGEI